jgi:hypothetical protein
MEATDQLHGPAASPPGKELRDRRLMDHKAGLKAVKLKPASAAGNRILDTQPVARRYTELYSIWSIILNIF